MKIERPEVEPRLLGRVSDALAVRLYHHATLTGLPLPYLDRALCFTGVWRSEFAAGETLTSLTDVHIYMLFMLEFVVFPAAMWIAECCLGLSDIAMQSSVCG